MKTQLIILLAALSSATLLAQPGPNGVGSGRAAPALQLHNPTSHAHPNVIPLIFPHPAPQLDTVTSHTDLYFPQLADGGNSIQKWQTTLTFVNLSTEDAAIVFLHFYQDPDGSPWNIDFGACGTGPNWQLTLGIPAGGMRVCQSQVSSPAVKVGWAYAYATVPVQATATFGEINAGVHQFDVSAEPTLPTWRYTSFANRNLGIAIANPYGSTISVALTAYDAGANPVGSKTISLSPYSHTSNILVNWLPSLPPNFAGSVTLTGVDPSSDAFIAWTLNSFDGTVISALPQGRVAWPEAPVTHYDQIWRAFTKIWMATHDAGYDFGDPPQLVTSISPTVDAETSPDGDAITITRALSQLISDSPGELAFILGHQMGHVYQNRNGGARLFQADPEDDADFWGILLTVMAGYDVYSAVGALEKEEEATGSGMSPGGFDGFADPNGANLDIAIRLIYINDAINQVCNLLEIKAICEWDRNVGHSFFPAAVPFAVHPKPKK